MLFKLFRFFFLEVVPVFYILMFSYLAFDSFKKESYDNVLVELLCVVGAVLWIIIYQKEKRKS